MITTHRDADYVRNEGQGDIAIRDLLEYAQRNVGVWLSGSVLWDLRGASIAQDHSDYAAIRRVVGNIHDLVEKRKGRKTVFVAPDPATYGMLRRAITIVERVESQLVASVFYDMRRAEAWLKGVPDL
jgi:hypothetical protein